MNDPRAFEWEDLVAKLKKKLLELGITVPDGEQTAFHNRIWETVNAAFERGRTTSKE